MSTTDRASQNREYVRRLLKKKQPEFAAVLDRVVWELTYTRDAPSAESPAFEHDRSGRLGAFGGDAGPVGDGRGFGAARGVEPGQNSRYVDAGGLALDEQVGGDVTVAATGGDQAQQQVSATRVRRTPFGRGMAWAPTDPGVTVSRHQALLALAVRLASARPRFPSARRTDGSSSTTSTRVMSKRGR